MNCVSVSVDGGDFSRDTTATFTINGPATITYAGVTFQAPISGSCTLTISAHGSIATVKVGAGDFGPFHSDGWDAPDPRAAPEVRVTGSATAQLTIKPEDICPALLRAMGPNDVWNALDDLPTSIPAALAAEAGALLDTVAGAIGTSGFPFFGDLANAAQIAIASTLGTEVNKLINEISTQLGNAWRAAVAALSSVQQTLREVLYAFCQTVLANALDRGTALVRLAASALRVCNVAAMEVANLLIGGLSQAAARSADAAKQALTFFGQCLDLAFLNGSDALYAANTALVGACLGFLDTIASELATFQRAIFDAIVSTASEAAQTVEARLALLLSFAKQVLVGIANATQDIAADAVVKVLLVVSSAAAGVTNAAVAVATLLGEVLQAVAALVAKLPDVMTALCSGVRWSKDELLTFLRHVGDNALVKQIAVWMNKAWHLVVAACTEVIDDIKGLIDQIAGFVQEAPGEIAEQMARLKSVFLWLQQLPGTVFGAAELANLPNHYHAALAAQQQGWINWLHAAAQATEGGGTTMVAHAKKLLGEGNEILAWFKRIGDQINNLLGPLSGEADDWLKSAESRMARFDQIERDLWDIVFAGGGGEGPFSVAARMHGLLTQGLQAAGGDIQVGEDLTQDSLLGAGENFVAGIGTQLASAVSFLSLEGRRDALCIPPPSEPGGVVLSQDGVTFVDVPTIFPFPGDATIAIAHLAEISVIDMRYHMPYGDMARYYVADRDSDGKVVDADVEAVRAAVDNEDAYKDNLDSDGDGKVTAADLQLVIEQKSRFLNGLMWRPSTAALAFWVQPAAELWALLSFGAPIDDDSIPGRLERRGLLNVYDMQLVVPLVNYPVRVHLEERLYMDRFPRLAEFGFAPPGFPSARYDLVVVGGQTARDFQIYATSEPWNPLLRTWTIKGSLCLRGMISGAYFGVGAEAGAGVAGRADLRLQVCYESGANMVEVLAEWHDRFEELRHTDITKLPVPWKAISAVMEYTELPRLCRAFIGIAGPVLDLFFDWTDPERHLRAALGYIHQTVLEGFTPCPTWEEMARELGSWTDEQMAPDLRDAVVAAVAALAIRLGMPGDAPMYLPSLLLQHLLAAVDAVLPPRLRPPLEQPMAKASARASLEKVEPIVSPPARLMRVAHVDGAAAPASPATPKDKAKAALVGLLGKPESRKRFVAGLDQLIDVSTSLPGWLPGESDLGTSGSVARPKNVAGQDSYPVTILGLGTFTAFDPKIWQIPNKDMIDHWDTIVGNPLTRSIYNSTVVFEPGAKLYAAPRASDDLVVGEVEAKAKGVVAGVCALEDPDGSWWFLVRTAGAWVHPKGPELKNLTIRQTREVNPATIPDSETAYRELVGEDAYAATKDMNKAQRIAYWEDERRRQAGLPQYDSVDVTIDGSLGESEAHAEQQGPVVAEGAFYGWLHLVEPDVREQIRYYLQDGLDIAVRALAPEALETGYDLAFGKLPGAVSRPASVTRFLASPLDSLDDVRWASLCRRALSRNALGQATVADQHIVRIYHECMTELRQRVFGAVHGDAHPESDVGPIVQALSESKQAHFWLHACAWLKCMYYVPRIATDFVDKIAPPLFKGDFGALPPIFKDVLQNMADFTPEEAALAAQEAIPYVKEAVIAIVHMCQKMRSAKDFVVSGGKGKGKGSETLDTANTDTSGPDFGNLGAYIFRLLMDDSGTPGADKNTIKDPDKKHGASANADITVSVDYESMGLKPILPDWPSEEDYQRQVGDDGYAATKDMSWTQRRDYWEEEAYKQRCGAAEGNGVDHYAATRTMSWPQREEYWKRVAAAQDKGKDGAPVDTDGISKIDKKYASGDMEIKFGRDKLGFTWSIEAGGGAGGGATAGTGASAAPTGNARLHFIKPQFSVELIENADSAAIAVRFFLRFLYHALDAWQVAIDWAKRTVSDDDKISPYFGALFWTNVFSALAVKEALNDIANDHAAFVVGLLEHLEFEFGFDVSAAASGELGIGLEGSAALKARGKVSLATLLAPLLDLLMSGARPSASGASILDRIEPNVTFHIDDRFQVKAHAAIGSLEVESTGVLLDAKFAIPKGSPLRAKMQGFGKSIEDAVFAWKDRNTAPPPAEVQSLRLILNALDHEVLALLKAYKDKDPGAALNSVPELCQQVFALIKGETPPPPTPPREPLTNVLNMLRSTHVRGCLIGVKPVLATAQNDDGTITVTMTVLDPDKLSVMGSGWTAPAAPEKLGEKSTWRIPLPTQPVSVGWSTYNEPRLDLFVEGLVAAFALPQDAHAFADARNKAWVHDAVENSVWTREARHWAWVDTDLVPALVAAKLPLPDVSLDGSVLVLRFPLVDPSKMPQPLPAALAAGTKIEATPGWKLTLMTDATAAEVDQIRAQIALNRAAGG